MKNHSTSEYFQNLLTTRHVTPTSRRVRILKILSEMQHTEFSFGELYSLMKKEGSLASTSSVANTLRLFKNTGLIKEVSPARNTSQSNRKKGRPERKFISINLLRW
jgi:Fe2+ or Zn2+ uptake regulation protein